MKLIEDKRPKAIDLFSGAGGFTLGIAKAGFNVVGHVEWDKYALATYEFNKGHAGFGMSQLIGKDITKITDKEVLDFKRKHKHIYLIIGGVPCQSFSLSGKREIGDPRDNLFLHYVRFVNLIRPTNCIFENVPGIMSKKSPDNRKMIDIIEEAFNFIGYKTVIAHLNASNYGVPQHRRRIFIYGAEDINKIDLPLPTHYGDKEGNIDTKNATGRHMYFTCSICQRRYGSFVYTKEREKVCIFCWKHQREIIIDKAILQDTTHLKVGHLVVQANIKIPAKMENIMQIRRKESRGSGFEKTEFVYCDIPVKVDTGIIYSTRWFLSKEVRHIADDDNEIYQAEAWIGANLGNNIKNAISNQD